MNGTVIKTKDFTMDLNLNLAHNKTMLDRLAPGVDHYTFDALNGNQGYMQIVVEDRFHHLVRAIDTYIMIDFAFAILFILFLGFGIMNIAPTLIPI